MFAKNTGKKIIGFGDLILLPDEVSKLPNGYDENHPTVKFYISKGLLAKASSADSQKAAKEKGKAKDKGKAKEKDINKANASLQG